MLLKSYINFIALLFLLFVVVSFNMVEEIVNVDIEMNIACVWHVARRSAKRASARAPETSRFEQSSRRQSSLACHDVILRVQIIWKLSFSLSIVQQVKRYGSRCY